MDGMKNWLRRYGATMFVVVGLAAVGLTVTQVQTQQRLPTRAAGEQGNQADEYGVWFEPETVYADSLGSGEVAVKLESLDQEVTYGRLVWRYDPEVLTVRQVAAGSTFTEVNSQVDGTGEVVVTGEGEFVGSGTWLRMRVQLAEGINQATLTVVPELSSLRYKNGGSRQIGGKEIVVTR